MFDGKRMIVAMSRRIAANLYKEIIALRPEWHNDDLSKGVIKVVMTSTKLLMVLKNATSQHHKTTA